MPAALRRGLRHLLALALAAAAFVLIAGKAVLDARGPYLEGLPAYPYCAEASLALAEERLLDALELADAGGCVAVSEAADRAWSAPAATFERCVAGVWTGFGDDAAGVACAMASDLLVFGDVRDLARQGLAWGRGDATDPLLIGLSAAGIVLTFAPQVGVGNALLKAARRAGSLSRGLVDQLLTLLRRGAWGAVANVSTDAGRIAGRLGLARGTRALAYADDAAELAALARFVEASPTPLLALRWSGKRAVRLADDPDLYAAALARGPAGLRLAVDRGGAALLARQPWLIAVGKALVKHPETLARWLATAAAWALRWATWPWVVAASGLLAAAAAIVRPGRRRAPRRSAGRRVSRVHERSAREHVRDLTRRR